MRTFWRDGVGSGVGVGVSSDRVGPETNNPFNRGRTAPQLTDQIAMMRIMGICLSIIMSMNELLGPLEFMIASSYQKVKVAKI